MEGISKTKPIMPVDWVSQTEHEALRELPDLEGLGENRVCFASGVLCCPQSSSCLCRDLRCCFVFLSHATRALVKRMDGKCFAISEILLSVLSVSPYPCVSNSDCNIILLFVFVCLPRPTGAAVKLMDG